MLEPCLYTIVPSILFLASIGYLAWHWTFVKKENRLHKWFSGYVC